MNKLFNRNRIIWIAFLLFICTACQKPFQDYNEDIDLSGTWKFQLNSTNLGIQKKWFNTALNDSLNLPGTTDENWAGKNVKVLLERTKDTQSIILDETPSECNPLIETIYNFARNHKIGIIFETRYGKESELICAIDLLNLQDKPEPRKLFYSILKYVESEKFSPENELEKEFLREIIP